MSGVVDKCGIQVIHSRIYCQRKHSEVYWTGSRLFDNFTWNFGTNREIPHWPLKEILNGKDKLHLI